MMQSSGEQIKGSDGDLIGSVPSFPPSDAQTTDNMGKLSLTDGHAVYMGSSHWATILEDVRALQLYRNYSNAFQIQQLKDELPDDDSDSVVTRESTPFHGSLGTKISLLTGVSCLSREQIMAMIPARKVVDRHISQFFNTFDLAPGKSQRRFHGFRTDRTTVILHRKKFLSEVRIQ